MIRVGFTGSRRPLSVRQENMLDATLRGLAPFELHHGDCVGADASAHDVARSLSFKARIVGHPPTDPSLRAGCAFDLVHPPATYLKRNRAIVDACTVLIAMPRDEPYKERIRSGTWSTVRYAREIGREVRILWPNGITTVEPAFSRQGS